MSAAREAVARFEATAEVTQRAIEGVGDDHWSLPSTCEGWSVEDLVRHLVEGNERLAASLHAGSDAVPSGDQESTWAERHRASTAAVAAGLRQPGVLDRPVTVPAGTMPGHAVAGLRTVESLVHAWDIATSTRQPLDVPDDVVDYVDGVTRQLLERVPPDRRPFKEPTTPPSGATPLDRLAALLGRQVPGTR
jgi:uncharacterized protein (TIGR03086 family)